MRRLPLGLSTHLLLYMLLILLYCIIFHYLILYILIYTYTLYIYTKIYIYHISPTAARRHTTLQPPCPGLEALASWQSFVWRRRSAASVDVWLRCTFYGTFTFICFTFSKHPPEASDKAVRSSRISSTASARSSSSSSSVWPPAEMNGALHRAQPRKLPEARASPPKSLNLHGFRSLHDPIQ